MLHYTPSCTLLYSTVLHWPVLYFTELFFTLLYFNVPHCIVLHCTLLHFTLLYSTLLRCTLFESTVLHCSVLNCTQHSACSPLHLWSCLRSTRSLEETLKLWKTALRLAKQNPSTWHRVCEALCEEKPTTGQYIFQLILDYFLTSTGLKFARVRSHNSVCVSCFQKFRKKRFAENEIKWLSFIINGSWVFLLLRKNPKLAL